MSLFLISLFALLLFLVVLLQLEAFRSGVTRVFAWMVLGGPGTLLRGGRGGRRGTSLLLLFFLLVGLHSIEDGAGGGGGGFLLGRKVEKTLFDIGECQVVFGGEVVDYIAMVREEEAEDEVAVYLIFVKEVGE